MRKILYFNINKKIDKKNTNGHLSKNFSNNLGEVVNVFIIRNLLKILYLLTGIILINLLFGTTMYFLFS